MANKNGINILDLPEDFDRSWLYPVGSIFFQSPSVETPASLFGGVWEEIGKDYFWDLEIIVWKRVK